MARLPDANDLGARPTPLRRTQIATVRNAGAVGQAVEGVGATLSDAARRLDELDQRRQAAQAGVDFARMTGEIQTESDKKRAEAGPGGAGHAEAIGALARQRTQQFLAGIKDKRVRQAFETDAAQLHARIYSNENAWEIGQRRELAVSNVEETGRLFGNQLRTNPDAAAFENYLGVVQRTIEGQGDLSSDLSAKLVRNQQAGLARAYIEGLKEKNAPAAREILNSGALDHLLTEDARSALKNQVDTEVRALEIEARRELTTMRTAAQERINIFQKRLTDHDPTITADELEEYQKLATQAGLPSEVYDIAKARVQHEVDRIYGKATGLEISTAIRDLNTRIETEGEKASPSDVVRRDHLLSLQTKRQQQDQNDPLTSHSLRGGQVDPLDPANPASIQSRLSAAKAAERETGYFSFYTPQEASLLQEQLATPSGRLDVINQVAAIGRYDTGAAMRAAEQIAPNDPTFRHAIRVNPAIRAMVVRGADARKTLPQKVTLKDGSSGSVNGATQAWFAAHISPSLVRSQPDFVNDVLETSRNLYAELMRTSGATGQEEFSEHVFSRAVNLALGKTASGGGMGQWNWGPRMPNGDGPGFLLPTGMSQADFEKRMANLPIAAKGGRWPQGAANGTPVWSDGNPLSTDQLRSRFVPVAIKDGVYQFEWNNQILMTREGRPFQLDIRRIEPFRASAAPKAQSAPNQTRAQPAIAPRPKNNVRGPVWVAPPR